METYALFCSQGLRDAIMRDIRTDTAQLEFPNGKLLVVNPIELPVLSIENDKQKLIATFENGYHNALALKEELRTLFDV